MLYIIVVAGFNLRFSSSDVYMKISRKIRNLHPVKCFVIPMTIYIVLYAETITNCCERNKLNLFNRVKDAATQLLI
jgi:hypothetical protein